MAGFFDKMFDFNRDGKLSAFERMTQVAAFASVMNDTKPNDDDDLALVLLDEDQRDELEDAGVDVFGMEFMGDEERISAIEDAGLDPEDYGFY